VSISFEDQSPKDIAIASADSIAVAVLLPWAPLDVLTANGPKLGESGANAPVFNGIAFCYERSIGTLGPDSRCPCGRRERGRRAKPAFWSVGFLPFELRRGRRPQGEGESVCRVLDGRKSWVGHAVAK
jgi:hypothetical protein